MASAQTPVVEAPSRVVARRVQQLRKSRGLSGTKLAEKLGEVGITWDRSTIAKLETGRRASITVDELLALALVLNVPPLALLVDPDSEQTAISPTRTEPTGAVLAWLAGQWPIDNDSPSFREAAYPAKLASDLMTALRLAGAYRTEVDHRGRWTAETEYEDQLRTADAIARSMAKRGMKVPAAALDPALADDARRLGLDLAGAVT